MIADREFAAAGFSPTRGRRLSNRALGASSRLGLAPPMASTRILRARQVKRALSLVEPAEIPKLVTHARACLTDASRASGDCGVMRILRPRRRVITTILPSALFTHPRPPKAKNEVWETHGQGRVRPVCRRPRCAARVLLTAQSRRRRPSSDSRCPGPESGFKYVERHDPAPQESPAFSAQLLLRQPRDPR